MIGLTIGERALKDVCLKILHLNTPTKRQAPKHQAPKRPAPKRQAHKTPGPQNAIPKTPGPKRSIEMEAPKRPVFKFDILIKQKV
jgi:hypothetical protein